MRSSSLGSALVLALAIGSSSLVSAHGGETGFTPIFDGKTLAGWTTIGQRGEGYGVKDGVL